MFLIANRALCYRRRQKEVYGYQKETVSGSGKTSMQTIYRTRSPQVFRSSTLNGTRTKLWRVTLLHRMGHEISLKTTHQMAADHSGFNDFTNFSGRRLFPTSRTDGRWNSVPKPVRRLELKMTRECFRKYDEV